jgi:hypothetical protein
MVCGRWWGLHLHRLFIKAKSKSPSSHLLKLYKMLSIMDVVIMVHDIDVSNHDNNLWWISNGHPFLSSKITSNKFSMCYFTKNCVVFIMKVLNVRLKRNYPLRWTNIQSQLMKKLHNNFKNIINHVFRCGYVVEYWWNQLINKLVDSCAYLFINFMKQVLFFIS